jgi:hypothetical protein
VFHVRTDSQLASGAYKNIFIRPQPNRRTSLTDNRTQAFIATDRWLRQVIVREQVRGKCQELISLNLESK